MLREDFLFDKWSFLLYWWKRISVDDNRLFLKGIGMLGVCVFCIFVVVIFIMDFNIFMYYGIILLRKIIRLKDCGGYFRKL